MQCAHAPIPVARIPLHMQAFDKLTHDLAAAERELAMHKSADETKTRELREAAATLAALYSAVCNSDAAGSLGGVGVVVVQEGGKVKGKAASSVIKIDQISRLGPAAKDGVLRVGDMIVRVLMPFLSRPAHLHFALSPAPVNVTGTRCARTQGVRCVNARVACKPWPPPRASLTHALGACRVLRGDGVQVAVDDKEVSALDAKAVAQLLRGPVGTSVRIKVQKRDGTTPRAYDVTLRRALPKVLFCPSVLPRKRARLPCTRALCVTCSRVSASEPHARSLSLSAPR